MSFQFPYMHIFADFLGRANFTVSRNDELVVKHNARRQPDAHTNEDDAVVVRLKSHQKMEPFYSSTSYGHDEGDRLTGSKFDEAQTKEPGDQFNESMMFVKYETGETIRLKCHIPNGPYLVSWT